MKRLIALLAALLALVGIAAWIPAGLPDQTAFREPVQTTSGVTYVAENTGLTARLYQFEDSLLTGLQRHARLQNGSSFTVTHLATRIDRVYLLREWDDGSLELVESGKTAKSIWKNQLPEHVQVTSLSAPADGFYVTCVAANGDVQVYALQTNGTAVLAQLLPAPAIGRVVRARYEPNSIRAELDTGEVCRFSLSGAVELLDEPYGPDAPDVSLSFLQWLLCKRNILLGAVAAWLALLLVTAVTTLISRRAIRLATRLTAICSSILLLALAVGYGLLLGWSLDTRGPGTLPVMALPAGLAFLIVWLSGFLGLRILTRRITAPLGQMSRQMASVADGSLAVQKDIPPSRDELRLLHQSIQELCMSLSIRDYELASTVRSYERFVPRDLTRLLERATVAEISYGDSQRLSGCVGLFAVCNRNEARAVLDDTSFCAFVDHSYALLEGGMQAHRGALLSGGLQLSSMEVLFPDAADGARAGLQFLGQAKVRVADDMPAPELLLILHETSFLYGVSGSQDKLFPYLSSSELEYLGHFTPQFHKAGVKIVVTDRCHAVLDESGLLTRYIGFITAVDGNGAHKLYEVLSAYPDVERNLRLRYDQRFQEALVLFYRDDFYLARNLFSTLLRACPEDGIVRWYLFACEHFFHQEAGATVDYQLFGINE